MLTLFRMYMPLYISICIFIYCHKEIFPAKDLRAPMLCHHELDYKEAGCHGYVDNPNTLCYVLRGKHYILYKIDAISRVNNFKKFKPKRQPILK